MANKIEIKISLSDKQKDVLTNIKRFNLWRAGRRSGKTYAAEYWFAKRALTKPNSVNWYVAQDTALCKELNVPLFEHIVPHELIIEYSKSDKCFTLFNGAKCYFKSANSSDSLRGRGLDTLVVEEGAFWRNGGDVFHNTLRPQLADRLGHCLVISSPPSKMAPIGAEWFRRLEQSYKEELANGSTDYATFHSNIWSNPFVDEAEKQNLKRTTDPDTWEIEYEGNYCDKVGQVYWEFDPLTRKFSVPATESVLMRIRGLDFGISDNTACSWVNLLSDNRVYVSDVYSANNLDVPTHAREINRLTTVPVQWTVLDSACWARDATLTSVAKRFGNEGINCTPGTKDLDGSISDMKLLMANGKLIIDPKFTVLLQSIDSWQHGQHEPDILAATRYAIDALIRTGKLMRPVSTAKPTFMNHLQQLDEMDRRQKRLDMQLSFKSKHNGNLPAFKIT